jgi:hypothetical protein
MPQDEHRMLELEEHIRLPLKEFLVRMFEHSFAAATETETKNLDMASGLTRNGVKQELKQIDESLSRTINESVGLLPACKQRLLIGRQLDIAEDVYLMGRQLAFQRLHRKGRCPIVRMEGDWIPLLVFEFGSDVWAGSDPFIELKFLATDPGERHREAQRSDISDALASEIPHLMERPFAQFLGARLSGSSLLDEPTAAATVEVQNTQKGWQVIYSPAYFSEQNVFGGPTPVTGHVAPGTYRFGIADPDAALWDPIVWKIPAASPIFIPIP